MVIDVLDQVIYRQEMTSWAPPGLPARWSGDLQPRYVGRRRELGEIEDAWRRVVSGDRQVLFIGGEPGAGKTRLVAEAARGLHRAGATVLIGTSVAELGQPYQPFDAPAATLCAGVADGVLATDAPLSAVDVENLLGTVCGRGTAVPRTGPDDPRMLYEAVVQAIRAAAKHTPVVLVLEDLHLASSTALQLLTYLVERTAEVPVLVLGTHRTTAPDRSDELIRRIAALYRQEGVRRLDLDPLGTDDIAEFLAHEGKMPAFRAGPTAVLMRDRTGGNPLFVRELWSELARNSGLAALRTGDESAAPEAVQDVLQHRVAVLSSTERLTLGLAAVIGEEVDPQILLAITGVDAGLTALDALVAAGLLEAPAGQVGTYRFMHALVRQAALAALPAVQRARHHEKVAQMLEERGGAVRLLAHHYAASHLLGHTEEAVRYLAEAADLAEAGLAHAEAARLRERAAGLCRDPQRRDEFLLAAGNSYQLACEFARSMEVLRRVVVSGDQRLRLRAAFAYEYSSFFSVRSSPETLELVASVLSTTPRDPSDPDYVAAVAALGRASALLGAHDRAETLVQEAIVMARSIGDPGLLGAALSASMQVGLRPATNAVKRRRAEELAELASEHALWSCRGPLAYHSAALAYAAGDMAALAVAHADLELVAGVVGQRYWSYMRGCLDFGLLLIRGQFAAARETSENLLTELDAFDAFDSDGPHGVQSFMVRRETGGLERIRSLITGDEPTTGRWPPALLALYTELGMHAAAQRILHELLSRDLALEAPSARWPGLLAFMAESAVALSDADAAAKVRPLLAEYAGLNLMMGPFVAMFGAADRLLAELDSLLGAGAPDDLFAAALELDTRTGGVLHQAHTLVAWAVHRRRAGDVDGACDLESRARSLAEPLGMARVLARLPRSGTAEAASSHPDGLTDRETEVLRLLGAGLSNRELARRLFISENTAANHVRSILTKTGSANRTQAAMYAARRGLSD